ncbi:GNAT family N-acetyltransferase [Dactylosporangium sp. NPDC049525]|uniref:GNAT family N-acetyltransferase n=1 Tax=Dactylosporangium sp. NPDC049525 TaxID=3154730 RepID=UPI003432F759
MIEVRARRATAADAGELVRLRIVMFESVDGVAPQPGEWSQEAVRSLRERLPEPDARTAAFVVDRPDEPGRLAACAVGAIDARLGSPSNPTGLHGYIFNVATDDGYRRRGYSRACMTGLLGWFRHSGIVRVQLHASDDGYELYRKLGFSDVESASMRISL